MNVEDTIAAISTPPGTGAISIVRLSGDECFSVLSRIFSTTTKAGSDFDWEKKSHRALHGLIVDPGSSEPVDEVVVIPYKGPRSYTGEDMAEINCHGNPMIARQILDLCLGGGARLARHGEFTQRAFLSGKLDLTQAEAVLDLIQARTAKQGLLSVSTLEGHLGKRIRQVRQSLMELMARIVAGIDFPEEIGELPEPDVLDVVDPAAAELDKLTATARSGRFLREGLKVAIVGRPNVGKSSLLNQLLRFERAIVTEIPGTTRDSIEEPLDINGIPITLVDTAGVRSTEDQVERIGIDRTERALKESDLAILMYDLSCGWSEEDEHIAALASQMPVIQVGNKLDLVDGAPGRTPPALENRVKLIEMSARTGEGLPALSTCIEEWALEGELIREAGGTLNQRQGELCRRACQSLALVRQAVEDCLPQDCLATDLKIAIECLSEVCGDEVTEELLSEVFARFCIGK